MSKVRDGIDDTLAAWLTEQHIFFVATAPQSLDGHVNCSPKGGDCFRVLSPNTVAYLDYTGSGAETAAHISENGRIVLMFCAFVGKPEVVRLHGAGHIVYSGSDDYASLQHYFPPNPGARAIIVVQVTRVSTSCGWSVPFMDFRENRDGLDKWAQAKGPDSLANYRQEKNSVSIDGLPAFVETPR